jgi:hypothetical protein
VHWKIEIHTKFRLGNLNGLDHYKEVAVDWQENNQVYNKICEVVGSINFPHYMD